jgi:hypothetical protein
MDHIGLVDEAQCVEHLEEHILHMLTGQELLRLDNLVEVGVRAKKMRQDRDLREVRVD